jgi:hypothetical protein
MNMGTFVLGFSLALIVFPASVTRIVPNGPQSEAEPTYDPATVIEVIGTVSAVWEVPAYLPLEGLHLAVKSGWETVDVYVGPTDFVKIFGVTFIRGDKIEVIGSKVMFGNNDIVLAAQIREGDATVVLRDKDGAPYWRSRVGLT